MKLLMHSLPLTIIAFTATAQTKMIYSKYRIPENYSRPQDIRNNNDGFMPVEVQAKYRDGEYAFYKTIYHQLANDKINKPTQLIFLSSE